MKLREEAPDLDALGYVVSHKEDRDQEEESHDCEGGGTKGTKNRCVFALET